MILFKDPKITLPDEFFKKNDQFYNQYQRDFRKEFDCIVMQGWNQE